ncbi:MAG: hypothetical protein CSB15_00205 [Clostridiales bacterium]|nr:MAG: hypothetical protein CSB15_00205 [Clostridiales bacterium]
MNNIDVTSYYRDIRDKNNIKRTKNIELAHQKCPELEKIDLELKNLNLELSSLFLSNISSIENTIETLENKRNNLLKEKSEIIREFGIDQNYDKRIYKCKECKDSGYIDKIKCNCYEKNTKTSLYKGSKLINILETQNFYKFNYNLYSNNSKDYDINMAIFQAKTPREYIKKIVEISKKIVDGEIKNSLYIYGPTGVGKTFLCSSITKYALDNYKTVEYYSSINFFDTLRKYSVETLSDNYIENEYDKIINSDILIIDDLGVETLSEFKKGILLNILDNRFMNNKTIIISSNIPIMELNEKYGDRISSRIKGKQFIPIKIVGKDLRI